MNKEKKEIISEITKLSTKLINKSKKEVMIDIIKSSKFFMFFVFLSISMLVYIYTKESTYHLSDKAFTGMIYFSSIFIFIITFIPNFISIQIKNKMEASEYIILFLIVFALLFLISLASFIVTQLVTDLFNQNIKAVFVFQYTTIVIVAVANIASFVEGIRELIKTYKNQIHLKSTQSDKRKIHNKIYNITNDNFKTIEELNLLITYLKMKSRYDVAEYPEKIREEKVKKLGFKNYLEYEYTFYENSIKEKNEIIKEIAIENN